MIINLDESSNEIWLNSTGSITNCLRDIESRIASTDSCYIIYDLYEPSYEQMPSYELELGVHNNNDDSNFYRYTGVFFFEDSFSELIKNAEEIKLTFYLMNREDNYLGSDDDDSSEIFNNNVLIKGHNYRSFTDLVNNWEQQSYNDFKYNLSCPYMKSIYKELKTAINEGVSEVSIILNNGILKDFEKYGVKGFQIYCHDTAHGKWSIDRNCLVEILRYKDYYNDTTVSTDAVVVKNNKIYNEEYFHIGNLNFHEFYFFEDGLESLLDKAEELEITFNLLWFLPTADGNCSLNINNNYLSDDVNKGCVQLVGHCFKNLEELKLFNTKNDIFEEDANLKILAYEDFKQAINEGHTSFTFKLNRENIEIFKEQNIKGVRLGLMNNGIGYIRTSKYCTVKITKYRNDIEFLYDYNSTENWISLDSATLIGKNSENNIDHAAFYFFGGALYDAVHDRIIENITVRLYFRDSNSSQIDPVGDATYHMCFHNFESFGDISENYIPRKNTLCSFKINNDSAEYRDIILTRTQINLLRDAKGLCFYSKDKAALTLHGDYISVYVSYYNMEDGHTHTREFEPISTNTFVKNSDKSYDGFLVGTTPDVQLYQPYAFLGDNFYMFMNSLRDDDIISVRISITADNIRRIENVYSSSNMVDLELYTHNVPFLQENYNTYKYKDFLFNTSIKCSEYIEMELSTAQIDILKNAYGLGAMLNNNINSEFIVIKEIKVSITYVS